VILFVPVPRFLARWRWALAVFSVFLVAAPLFALGWVDVELVRFVKTRMTANSLFLFNESNWKASDIVGQYFLLTAAAFSSLGLWTFSLWRIARRGSADYRPGGWRFAVTEFIVLILILSGLVLGARGGYSNSKPLNVVDTYPELQLGNWSLNTTFVFLKGLGGSPLAEKKYFDDHTKLISYLNGSVKTASSFADYRRTSPQNIVVIIMESLSLGYMGEVNKVAGYTPFLDKLASKSLFFTQAYANSLRSIEGIPAVLGGIPSLGPEPFLVSPYADTEFDGLGSVLSRNGYTTAFFHGAKKGTMSFDKFAVRAGFQKYFAKEDYPDQQDFDGTWGIFDEPYFQYVASELDTMYATGKPFGVGVFSLSAHHPYRVPPKYEKVLPEGTLPILKPQAYADLALKRFFETAKTKPWYKDTLFVITADHGAEPYLKSYKKDSLNAWRIPIIFFHPSIRWPVIETAQPVQQIDILPSVLDVLAISSGTTNPLSRSVFKLGRRVCVLRSSVGTFAIAGDDVLFESENDSPPASFVRQTLVPRERVSPDLLFRRSV
jgi:phosphoglycerol transferase MdoB-like AlkP superfamily enzyme